jgi:toxin ParE1/3/4
VQLSVSQPAADDLANIAAYVKLESIQRAVALIDRLERAFRQLSVMPTMGKRRDDLELGIRAWVEAPYVIAYRIDVDVVRIVRVIPGRRDFTNVSFDDLE